jgi:uncharacterized membrane protein YfcA
MLLQMFHSSPTLIVIGLACALVVAGLMKGIVGVGMATYALPMLSLLIDVRAAVMLLAVPLILSNIPQALEGGRTLECFKRLAPVLLGMMPGVLLGVAILLLADCSTIKVVAGCVIVLVAALTLLAPKFQLREGLRTPVGLCAGFASGVLGGVGALLGPFVFTFLLAKGLHGKDFTKEASLFLVLSSAFLAVSLVASSTFDTSDLAISTAALIPVSLGMSVGRKLRNYIPANLFRTAILSVVLLSGLGILVKTLAGAP